MMPEIYRERLFLCLQKKGKKYWVKKKIQDEIQATKKGVKNHHTWSWTKSRGEKLVWRFILMYIPYWAHYLLSWCEVWIHWKSPPCSNFVSECKCWVLRFICTIAICHPRTFYSPTLTKFLPQNGNQASEPWEITSRIYNYFDNVWANSHKFYTSCHTEGCSVYSKKGSNQIFASGASPVRIAVKSPKYRTKASTAGYRRRLRVFPWKFLGATLVWPALK